MLCLRYFLCDYTININNFMLKCELNSLTVWWNKTNLQTFIKVSFFWKFLFIFFFEIRRFIFPFLLFRLKTGLDEFNLWFIMNHEYWVLKLCGILNDDIIGWVRLGSSLVIIFGSLHSNKHFISIDWFIFPKHWQRFF